MAKRRLNPRKLLVASAGVATVNYLGVACDGAAGPTIANLMAPVITDAGSKGDTGARDARPDTSPISTVANLVAPAPHK